MSTLIKPLINSILIRIQVAKSIKSHGTGYVGSAVNSSSPKDHQKACNPGTVLRSVHYFQQDYLLIPISFLSLTHKERKGSYEK